MRKIDIPLTVEGKGQKNKQSHRGKSFGYQVLGFGAGGGASPFVVATGGTITCSGDYKIHTFTGDGTFTVTNAGNPGGSDTVEYLVVAGGGSGSRGDGTHGGGGGGAGGFRFASPSIAPLTYPAKPLAGPAALPVTVTGYPITVGGGGAGVDGPPGYSGSGANSVFAGSSTITSTGGGGGGFGHGDPTCINFGKPGGSGGGAGTCSTLIGTGNTPPVSPFPPQGNNGGLAVPYPTGYRSGGGGGGAMAVGTNGTSGPGASRGGPGGAGGGFPSAFGTSGQSCSPFYYFAGGAGAGPRSCSTTPTPTGGLGGGGPGAMPNGTAGTTNTGGGGGAASGDCVGANGGPGIVIIRYKYQ